MGIFEVYGNNSVPVLVTKMLILGEKLSYLSFKELYNLAGRVWSVWAVKKYILSFFN
jgi:hypothetical protein